MRKQTSEPEKKKGGIFKFPWWMPKHVALGLGMYAGGGWNLEKPLLVHF